MSTVSTLSRQLFRLRTKRERLDRRINQLVQKLARKREPGKPRPVWGNCSKAK